MIAKVIEEHLRKRIENGEISNQELIQLIEVVGSYLNLMTIPDYAKRESLTYNGVKSKARANKIQIIQIFGCKFVVDNF